MEILVTATLSAPVLRLRGLPRKRLLVGLSAVVVLGLMVALPSHALDLIGFTGITGPLVSALTQISALTPSVKALIAVVTFIVAFISLAALRNFGPVLNFIGAAIFGAVGLTIAGAILGATI